MKHLCPTPFWYPGSRVVSKATDDHLIAIWTVFEKSQKMRTIWHVTPVPHYVASLKSTWWLSKRFPLKWLICIFNLCILLICIFNELQFAYLIISQLPLSLDQVRGDRSQKYHHFWISDPKVKFWKKSFSATSTGHNSMNIELFNKNKGRQLVPFPKWGHI